MIKLIAVLTSVIFIISFQLTNAQINNINDSFGDYPTFIKVHGNETITNDSAIVLDPSHVQTTITAEMVSAMEECYSSIIRNDRDKALTYYNGNISPHFGLDRQCDGEVKIIFSYVTSSKYIAIVRLSLEIEKNSYCSSFDTHIWQKDLNGKWKVKSLIYN